DIYFRQGAYDPASQKGRETIAHEVVHTVQQRDTAPAIQRRRERTEPLDLTGLTVVAQAIHDALYPTGDSWIAGMAEAVLPHVYVGMIAPVARVVGLRSPDERRAIDTLRRTPDKAGLRSVYHAIYGRSVERDFLARTSERTFREVLLILRPSYSLVDLVRVYLLRYPFPDSGLLLPIAAGRYFGDDAILAAMRIATRADLDELASHAALLNELSDEMEVGSWYEATKLLDPARTSTMFREAAAARMRMAGDDLGTVLDVLLDIPQEHRPAFWNRYGANASGLDWEDIPIAARVAVGTDATGYATRLEVAARAGDQAAIERAIQGLAQIRHARRVLESTPDAPDRESALERLGDVDELLEVTEFGGLPAPIRALARSGAAAQTIDAARRLGVPLFHVAVTTILEHASDYGQILAVLRAIPDSNTRRGVWEEVRAIVEARIVSEEISQEEFDRLAGVATGDSYETALAELTAAIQSNDVNALFTVIEGMSAADRDRLRSSPPPFWRGLVANRHVGGRFLAQTAETGVIPSQALIAYALSGVTPNRELLEVALEALPDTERARYRRGYYLLSEGIEPQSDSDRQAVADYQRLFALIDNYFGRESRTALLEQLLDVPSPEALTTPQGRLEAAAILRRRLLVRAAMEGDAAGEIFTDADENLFAATMEFERLYQEAIRDGEIDEEEM
ncbi:MAG TPA: DUF4157 domain-containing protein, partial [Sandaracinaceae bacterium]